MLISFFHFSVIIGSGTSSVALAWSGTFDDLIGGHISNFFKENAPMELSGLAPYPDVFATVLVLLLSGKMVTRALFKDHTNVTTCDCPLSTSATSVTLTPCIFPKIASSVRYHVCFHLVHIH